METLSYHLLYKVLRLKVLIVLPFSKSDDGEPEGVLQLGFRRTDLPESVVPTTADQLQMNNAGAISFRSLLRNSKNTELVGNSIFLLQDSSIELLPYSGSLAPGLGVGVEFLNLDAPVLSESGAVAFRSAFQGPGINIGNNEALWIYAPNGGLQMVARLGEEMDVTESDEKDDLRTIEEFRFDAQFLSSNQLTFGLGSPMDHQEFLLPIFDKPK